jgi:dCMP deaminase
MSNYTDSRPFSTGNSKISWEEYAMKLAETAMLRSADPWQKVGCCLLRHDNSVASLGFNGFPKGMLENWDNREERRKFVVHAEQNALRYVKPGECYLAATTLLCCNDCLKALASYGIKTVVYKDLYEFDNSSEILASQFGIQLIKV